jgi:PE family
MSFVNATPEYVAAAASDLANIGSSINSANSAALGPTSSLPAAGADVVSQTIAQLFGAHSEAYQALSAQAASFHQQFVELMNGGAAQYALAEAANAAPLQTVEQTVVNEASASTQALTTGQPLIGTAAQAASTAASVPTSVAGMAGGATPAASAGTLATSVSPAPAAATASTTTPVAAAPAAPAASAARSA